VGQDPFPILLLVLFGLIFGGNFALGLWRAWRGGKFLPEPEPDDDKAVHGDSSPLARLRPDRTFGDLIGSAPASLLSLLMSLLALGFGLLILLLCYGVVVIVFRYAFGVELWNPFH
jgi:hypothetical protein